MRTHGTRTAAHVARCRRVACACAALRSTRNGTRRTGGTCIHVSTRSRAVAVLACGAVPACGRVVSNTCGIRIRIRIRDRIVVRRKGSATATKRNGNRHRNLDDPNTRRRWRELRRNRTTVRHALFHGIETTVAILDARWHDGSPETSVRDRSPQTGNDDRTLLIDGSIRNDLQKLHHLSRRDLFAVPRVEIPITVGIGRTGERRRKTIIEIAEVPQARGIVNAQPDVGAGRRHFERRVHALRREHVIIIECVDAGVVTAILLARVEALGIRHAVHGELHRYLWRD